MDSRLLLASGSFRRATTRKVRVAVQRAVSADPVTNAVHYLIGKLNVLRVSVSFIRLQADKAEVKVLSPGKVKVLAKVLHLHLFNIDKVRLNFLEPHLRVPAPLCLHRLMDGVPPLPLHRVEQAVRHQVLVGPVLHVLLVINMVKELML